LIGTLGSEVGGGGGSK